MKMATHIFGATTTVMRITAMIAAAISIAMTYGSPPDRRECMVTVTTTYS